MINQIKSVFGKGIKLGRHLGLHRADFRGLKTVLGSNSVSGVCIFRNFSNLRFSDLEDDYEEIERRKQKDARQFIDVQYYDKLKFQKNKQNTQNEDLSQEVKNEAESDQNDIRDQKQIKKAARRREATQRDIEFNSNFDLLNEVQIRVLDCINEYSDSVIHDIDDIDLNLTFKDLGKPKKLTFPHNPYFQILTLWRQSSSSCT